MGWRRSTSRCVSAIGTCRRTSTIVRGNLKLGSVFVGIPTLTPILPSVRRGILGGTFDPPHLAHLLGGEAAYRELGLDVVTLMPAGSPWQKAERDVTAAADRWEMIVLATGGTDYFVADDREVRRPGWTYTIDTLESMDPDEDLVLIIGADAALGLPTWQRAEEILQRVTLAVIPRPTVDRETIDGMFTNHHWLDVPALPISGTMLRQRARSGSSIRFFVPELVHDYVVRHRLYDPA
jgi:nicotinate-nucleotide adenylyltransferase